MERDLEQEIAQLIAERRKVSALDRVGDFVGLLDRVRRDGPEILLKVPGAARSGSRSRAMISSSRSIGMGLGAVQDFTECQQHAGRCAPDIEAAPGQVVGLDLLARDAAAPE